MTQNVNTGKNPVVKLISSIYQPNKAELNADHCFQSTFGRDTKPIVGPVEVNREIHQRIVYNSPIIDSSGRKRNHQN